MCGDLTQIIYITNNCIKTPVNKDTVLTGQKMIYHTSAKQIRIGTFMQLG